uniref:Uncharacterized protein n=1 Tax=Haptolina brevifila TaxID=156173 RepID=A0A7S2BZ48_9EUKA|mmetsp:Transcript_18314/g.37034  ORF Transcript_18314/g.37034 Transcript_18314/m.37034 type:complete len:195 (+) Transcript_18314:258-842(+)
MATIFTIGHMFVMLSISTLPSLILNGPVGIAALMWAKAKQRASLKHSSVKLSAHDVLLSEKMKFAIVGVPLLWLSYAAVLLGFTTMQTEDVLTLLMVAPVASYLGVISAESGMIALRDLRPIFMRLLHKPSAIEALKAEQLSLRRCVQEEIENLVKTDEVVRELYHQKGELCSADWERLRERSDDQHASPPTLT